MTFFSIGSGSSGNCYCLSSDNHSCLMIDCGLGMRAIKKAFHDRGIPLTDIRAILVTHAHADHVKSVGSLCQQLLVPVYATRDTHQGIYHNHYVHCKIPGNLIQTIDEGATFQVDDFRITSFAIPHDCVGHVGYTIEIAGTVFTIVTDCGHPTDIIRHHIMRSHYLVLEANYDLDMLLHGRYPYRLKTRIQGDMGHLDNTVAAQLLAESATPQLRHVWLCHLSQENNTPEQALHAVTTCLRSHGIVAGKDFLLDALERKQPSRAYEIE